MELRALELLLNITATGSFSRTATLDMTTQLTVSKSIAQLETELGDRGRDGVGAGRRRSMSSGTRVD